MQEQQSMRELSKIRATISRAGAYDFDQYLPHHAPTSLTSFAVENRLGEDQRTFQQRSWSMTIRQDQI
ncbi:hypothetical protein ACFONN_17650 [Dyella humi]|uniref:Uncharacterized protein n=1 Tax=Dyella humi TaxID=1770547 RepID=A0ABW8IEE1_9GAMM